MNRLVIACAVAGLSLCPALLATQTPPAGRGNAGVTRRSFEKSTVEGQPMLTDGAGDKLLKLTPK